MILSAVSAALSVLVSGGEAIQLAHAFTAGEKTTYEVRSNLSAQHRQRGLETWIPEDFDINYQFSIFIKSMKADGVAEVIYLRPTMTTIEGETFDSPPKTKVEKLNLNMLMSLSPANEILNVKDLNPPKKEKGGKGKDGRIGMVGPVGTRQLPFIGQFIGEVHRLALFAGNFESALDFAPRLPFEKLKVGDTWKRTVGYTPQKNKDKEGKTINQRLDYTFTYQGTMDQNGRKIQRVLGECSLDTNLADFINQMFDVKPEDTGLKSIPLQLKTKIDFDLDPKTMKTISANATSEGGFKIILTDLPNDPIEEETFKGRTQLRILSQTIVKPSKATR
jgi:hypothetical protein